MDNKNFKQVFDFFDIIYFSEMCRYCTVCTFLLNKSRFFTYFKVLVFQVLILQNDSFPGLLNLYLYLSISYLLSKDFL